MSEKSSTVSIDSEDPPRMRFPNWSINGTGIMLYGGKPLSDGTFEVTRWIAVLCVPLLPLSTWEIQPVEVETFGTDVKHRFHIVAKRPLNFKHILLAYLFIVIGGAPLAILLSTPFGADLPIAITVVAWAMIFLGGGLYKYDRAYKKARKTQKRLI